MVDDQPHVPVLLDRCVELLAPALTREGATLVDEADVLIVGISVPAGAAEDEAAADDAE